MTGWSWQPFSRMLPDRTDTLFLRACLDQGERGLTAWNAWRRLASPDGDRRALMAALAAHNTLLPLLYWQLARNGVTLDRELSTYLRSAHLTEGLRWDRYREILATTLGVLIGANLRFIVLKGASVAEQYYPSPLQRHTDDIDLLLAERDLPQAAALFVERGWRAHRTRSFIARNHRHLPTLEHVSGVPLELHRRIVRRFFTIDYDALWRGSVRTPVAGVDARILSPSDTLLHVCLHAMAGRVSLRWIPDAVFVVTRHPGVDWPAFLDAVRAARAAAPVYAVLQYLAGPMALPIPADVLAATRDQAQAAGFIERRAVRPLPTGTAGEIWRSEGPPWARAARILQRAVPSPISLAVQFDLPLWQIPIEYAHRVVRGARHLRGEQRRPPAQASPRTR